MPAFVDSLGASLARWITRRRPEVHQVRGFRVVLENSRPDISSQDVLHRLDDALALIERHLPSRYRHLQRDLLEIWIVRYPCRGAYFHATRACLTELTFLARRDISAAVVASSILHEGVHARIDRFRGHFGSSDGDHDGAREERICRAAELRFGLALPPDLGGPVIDRARDALTLDDASVKPDIDWELASARQDIADSEAAGLPARATVTQVKVNGSMSTMMSRTTQPCDKPPDGR